MFNISATVLVLLSAQLIQSGSTKTLVEEPVEVRQINDDIHIELDRLNTDIEIINIETKASASTAKLHYKLHHKQVQALVKLATGTDCATEAENRLKELSKTVNNIKDCTAKMHLKALKTEANVQYKALQKKASLLTVYCRTMHFGHPIEITRCFDEGLSDITNEFVHIKTAINDSLKAYSEEAIACSEKVITENQNSVEQVGIDLANCLNPQDELLTTIPPSNDDLQEQEPEINEPEQTGDENEANPSSESNESKDSDESKDSEETKSSQETNENKDVEEIQDNEELKNNEESDEVNETASSSESKGSSDESVDSDGHKSEDSHESKDSHESNESQDSDESKDSDESDESNTDESNSLESELTKEGNFLDETNNNELPIVDADTGIANDPDNTNGSQDDMVAIQPVEEASEADSDQIKEGNSLDDANNDAGVDADVANNQDKEYNRGDVVDADQLEEIQQADSNQIKEGNSLDEVNNDEIADVPNDQDIKEGNQDDYNVNTAQLEENSEAAKQWDNYQIKLYI